MVLLKKKNLKMTKNEQDLILALTKAETAIARMTCCDGQESLLEDIDKSFAALKFKLYNILLEKEE